MERVGACMIRSPFKGDSGPKGRPQKAAFAARAGLADTDRIISVFPDDDTRVAREMEIPQHVASREARKQKILRIGFDRSPPSIGSFELGITRTRAAAQAKAMTLP